MSNTITTLTQSLLQVQSAQLVLLRTPNSVYELQDVTIPGLSISTLSQPTPFVNLPLAGTKMEFDPLVVTFLLDEAMTAWFDVFNWLVGLGRPENAQQYASLAANAPPNSVGIRPPYSDAILNIFTAKNNPQLSFQFADCFPVALDGVQMIYTSSASQIITAKATFRYSYYAASTINSNT